MNCINIRRLFEEHLILAILRNVPAKKAIDYVEAIIKGGVNCFEVALNSSDAYEQIAMLKEAFKDEIIIGAGTAITIERAENAVQAGAEFLLTPSVSEEILEYCYEHRIPLLPGVLTPSDVALCQKYGYDVMKLFPADAMPENYIERLKGPFNGTDYVAIGGVSSKNIELFFKRGYLSVGLASNIMPKGIVEKEAWEEGSQYIKNMVKKIKKQGGKVRK